MKINGSLFLSKRKSIRSEFPMTSCLGLSAIKFLFQVDVTLNNSGWKQWPLKVDIRIKIQKTDFAYFVIRIVFFNGALKKFIYNKKKLLLNNSCFDEKQQQTGRNELRRWIEKLIHMFFTESMKVLLWGAVNNWI